MSMFSRAGVVVSFCIAGISTLLQAEVLRVPDDFVTVQIAVDASTTGDTVLLSHGEYLESISIPDRDITLAGQFIFSQDSADIEGCVIRAAQGGSDRCLRAEQSNGTRDTLRVIGITIKGRRADPEAWGGGIDVNGRILEIRHCNLDSSYSHFGGALYAHDCVISLYMSSFRATGAHESGVVAYLRECTSNVVSCKMQRGFSTRQDPTESIFWIEGGLFTLRNSTIEDYGWTIVPGAHAIRQIGIPEQIEIVACEIQNNRFHRFFRLPGEDVLQRSSIRFDSNLVENNEFQHDLFSTDESDTGSVSSFRFNTFARNSRLSEGNWVSRMLFTLSGTTQDVDVSHNLFEENEAQENSVALIASPTDSNFIRFHNNFIFSNSADGFANPPGGVIMAISVNPGVIFHNVIAESHGYAAFQGLWSFPESHAPFNYWGDSTGPRQSFENPEGQGDSVEHLVSVVPWSVDSTFDSENILIRSKLPTDFALGFPYPNPFNSSVTIEYALTREQEVEVIIFDLLGREIEKLVDERQQTGVHQITWSADNFASGIYFAQLSSAHSPQSAMTTKLLLLK